MKRAMPLFIVLLTIFGCLFYWYAIRPVYIKKDCDAVAWKAATEGGYAADSEEYNWKYSQCLHSKGF